VLLLQFSHERLPNNNRCVLLNLPDVVQENKNLIGCTVALAVVFVLCV
jgi:hypothetical protein